MAGILSTTFTPVGTVRALAGTAAVSTGLGKVVDTDAFQQQAGEIIASAIETARQNQANQIEINLKGPQDPKASVTYDIYRAQRDVIAYHNMCSFRTALEQVRKSLTATAPDGGLTPPAKQGNQTPGGLAPGALATATTQLLGKTNEPIPSSVHAPVMTKNRFGAFEQMMPESDIRKIQAALCVAVDGDLGVQTATASQTRTAILGFLTGKRSESQPTGPVQISQTMWDRDIGQLVNLGTCKDRGFVTAYEVGAYGIPANRSVTKIKDLQATLNTLLPPETQPLKPTGIFDTQTRDAILAVRTAPTLSPKLPGQTVNTQIDAQFDKFLDDQQ